MKPLHHKLSFRVIKSPMAPPKALGERGFSKTSVPGNSIFLLRIRWISSLLQQELELTLFPFFPNLLGNSGLSN